MVSKYVVFSKPLQFFNAFNIPDIDESCTFLMTDSFTGARQLYHKLKMDIGLNIYFFDNAKLSYEWLIKNSKNGDYLFINSDYGVLQTYWLYYLRKRNIYVYEEGVGTYRMDLMNKSSVIKSVLRFLGFKSYFGGGRFTKGIYVYDINKYLVSKPNFSKLVKDFRMDFLSHLKEFKYKYLLNSDKDKISKLNKKKVYLYLTSWKYNNKIIDLIPNDYIKVIKPHPHVNSLDLSKLDSFDVVFGGEGMVEFLIYDLLQITSELVIAHESSSALLYLNSGDNFSEVIL